MIQFSDPSILGMTFTITKFIIRFVWVLATNVYSIGSYICYMMLLRPVLWFNPQLYWWIEGYLFRGLLMMVAHWMWSAGHSMRDAGDDLSDCTDDEALVLSNHLTTADVPSLMHWVHSKGMVPNRIMWIIYYVFKFTNFGVVSTIRGDFFIKQGKDTRNQQTELLCNHMLEKYWSRDRKWILLFPEGGFLRNNREKSQMYAKKNGLPVLEHAALPRVGAVKTILDVASPKVTHANGVLKAVKKPLKWVIDITICYPDYPNDILAIFGGWRKPFETTIYSRKYPIEEVPIETEELTKWLYDRYVEKEHLLSVFYATGKFPDSEDIGDKKLSSHPRSQGSGSRSQSSGLLTFTFLDFLPYHTFWILSFYVFWKIAVFFFCGAINMVF